MIINTINKYPFLLIILGPTGCGKTALSNIVSQKNSSQIINADVGQFYKPLSIGTAKPDLKNQKVKHNLFDLCDSPEDLSVFEYDKLVTQKVNSIYSKQELPILVGGSLFYIKSLFFSLRELQKKESVEKIDLDNLGQDDLWNLLNKIDKKRAQDLHPNDIYRVKRALDIWKKTGEKPSEYNPIFNPKFNSLFVFIDLPKTELDLRINQRTEFMIKQEGWIQEAERFFGTPWQDFIIKKGLIGYPEIFKWIEEGKKEENVKELIDVIQLKTRQYAKKQIKFWNSFKKKLEEGSNKNKNFICSIITVDNAGQKAYFKMEKTLQQLLVLQK